jgi:hypothetical protein
VHKREGDGGVYLHGGMGSRVHSSPESGKRR